MIKLVYYERITAIALSVALCFGQPDNIQTADAASQAKIHQAYEKVIKSQNRKIKKMGFQYYYPYFTYHDLDHDGVDELFIQCIGGTGDENSVQLGGGTDVIIYTFISGKPKKLQESLSGGGNWGGYYFHQDSKYLEENVRSGWSEGESVYKKLVKGKFVKAGECSYQAKDFSDASAGMNYKVNGKSVTEKKYKQYVKKMGGTKMLKMYKMTEENMQKLR